MTSTSGRCVGAGWNGRSCLRARVTALPVAPSLLRASVRKQPPGAGLWPPNHNHHPNLQDEGDEVPMEEDAADTKARRVREQEELRRREELKKPKVGVVAM